MTTEEFKNTIIPYAQKLYPLLFRILKDEEETRDALQDLMIRLWKKRDYLVNCTNRSAYIFTMAKNQSFDLLKKKQLRVIGKTEKYKLLNLESGETSQETKEKFENVHKVIESLPEKYQTVIRLRDIDGFSFDEIKEMTGYEVPNIRVILSRARMKVREEMEKIYNYDTTGTFA